MDDARVITNIMTLHKLCDVGEGGRTVKQYSISIAGQLVSSL